MSIHLKTQHSPLYRSLHCLLFPFKQIPPKTICQGPCGVAFLAWQLCQRSAVLLRFGLPQSIGAQVLGFGITTLLTWWSATGHTKGRAGDRPQHEDFAAVGLPVSGAKGLAESRVQRMHLPSGTSALPLHPFRFWLPWPTQVLCAATCIRVSYMPRATLVASRWPTGTSAPPYLYAHWVVLTTTQPEVGGCSTRPMHAPQGQVGIPPTSAVLENVAKWRKVEKGLCTAVSHPWLGLLPSCVSGFCCYVRCAGPASAKAAVFSFSVEKSLKGCLWGLVVGVYLGNSFSSPPKLSRHNSCISFVFLGLRMEKMERKVPCPLFWYRTVNIPCNFSLPLSSPLVLSQLCIWCSFSYTLWFVKVCILPLWQAGGSRSLQLQVLQPSWRLQLREWGFLHSSFTCCSFSWNSLILTHALQFRSPSQHCRVESMPGSLWKCQGQGCLGEPQRAVLTGGESRWYSTGCIPAISTLAVIMQGSATREITFSPKLEDVGAEHLKADVAPFLIQYWCWLASDTWLKCLH